MEMILRYGRSIHLYFNLHTLLRLSTLCVIRFYCLTSYMKVSYKYSSSVSSQNVGSPHELE